MNVSRVSQKLFVDIGGSLDFSRPLVCELQSTKKTCGIHNSAFGFRSEQNVIAFETGEAAASDGQSVTVTHQNGMARVDEVFGHEWSFGLIKVTTDEGRSALSPQHRV